MQPIFSAKEAANLNFHLIGLEISPLYRDPKTDTLFPLVRRRYIRLITRILHQAFFTYAHTQTTHHPPHYHALGKNALVKTVWEVDRKIAEISKSFDFLWYVTPIHSESSWNEFKRKEFQSAPVFQYRPQIIYPAILKRNLWNIPIEKLEDPTIGQLFREKRQELDVQISMLENIESKRFLYGSMQLYGNISNELFENASDLLERIPPRSRESSNRQYLDAQQFAELAREEILYYREMNATVEVRDDLTGLMVLKGHLKLSSFLKIPKSRVEALLNHEVGTHIVTFYNAKTQPFNQLNFGLADYEELQEGLAVFAEYLAGGLSAPRVRLLAARVLAAKLLIDGASFVDTYWVLYEKYKFAQRTAYGITVRIYRGGGLTKDMIYLRGLLNLLKYIQNGGDIQLLFIGKFAEKHIPIIKELQYRKLLYQPPLSPRYMALSTTKEKIEQVQRGVTVLDLIERKL